MSSKMIEVENFKCRFILSEKKADPKAPYTKIFIFRPSLIFFFFEMGSFERHFFFC